MGITMSTAARNAAANAVVDLLDAGTTNSEGRMVIRTSGDTLLCELPLSNPAFGSASSGVATAGAITTGTAVAAGTAAKHTMEDRDETEVWEGTAAAGSGDLNMSSTTIAINDQVSCSAYTYTQPAS